MIVRRKYDYLNNFIHARETESGYFVDVYAILKFDPLVLM
jgi:hypothetical protein